MTPTDAKPWQDLLLGSTILTAVLLLVVWAMVRQPGPESQSWVLLSIPDVEFRTNAGVALPKAIVRVSNVGPQAVDFRLCWFECRAKRQKTLLATNRFASLIVPLGPGESTNLTMNVQFAGLPVAEYSCCGEVLWAERKSMFHRWHGTVDRLLNTFEVTRNPRWYSRELQQGCAIAGNVDPAVYFREMYGNSRTQWLADARRLRIITRKPVTYATYFPTADNEAPDENAKRRAVGAFLDFCRTSTNSVSDGD
jgi:hypothetical protein